MYPYTILHAFKIIVYLRNILFQNSVIIIGELNLPWLILQSAPIKAMKILNCTVWIVYHLDDNECSIDNGGCDHTCENTPGSFQCGCNTGYELESDKIDCTGIKLPLYYIVHDIWLIDINECTLGTDYCQHNCHNSVGSYTCSCDAGYKLDSSGYHCTGEWCS